MKPVLQTTFGERGNCMSAALASILEIPLESIPCFYDAGPSEAHWQHALTAWLESLGYALLKVSVARSAPDCAMRGYAIASGPSPRNPDIWHAVVWKDGKVVHDPQPSGEPLERIEILEFLYPLDPSSGGKRYAIEDGIKVPLAVPDDVKKRLAKVMQAELGKNWQSDEDVINSFSVVAAHAYAAGFSHAAPEAREG